VLRANINLDLNVFLSSIRESKSMTLVHFDSGARLFLRARTENDLHTLLTGFYLLDFGKLFWGTTGIGNHTSSPIVYSILRYLDIIDLQTLLYPEDKKKCTKVFLLMDQKMSMSMENGDGKKAMETRAIGIPPTVVYSNEAVVVEAVSAYPVSPEFQMRCSQFPQYTHSMSLQNEMYPIAGTPVSNPTGTIIAGSTGGIKDNHSWINDPDSNKGIVSVGGLIAMIFQWVSFIGLAIVIVVSTTTPTKALTGLPFCAIAFIFSTSAVWFFAYRSSMYKFISNKNVTIKYFSTIPAMEMKIFHQVHCFRTKVETSRDSDTGKTHTRRYTRTTHKAELVSRFLS
jgi:hypothetical protein